MRLRPFAILTDRHPDLGRVPVLLKPHIEIPLAGAIYGTDAFEVAKSAAREGFYVPAGIWMLLKPWQQQWFIRRGVLAPVAGAGQQESYRALGASFAITSTIHVHIKLLGGSTQQATMCMSEASFDGTSGIATLEFDTSTEASAGTAGTAPTTTQVRRFPAVAQATTVSGNYSAEGTTYTAINMILLPMPTAPFIIQYPLGRELETQPTASTNGKALIMRGSTTVNCNMRGMWEFEE